MSFQGRIPLYADVGSSQRHASQAERREPTITGYRVRMFRAAAADDAAAWLPSPFSVHVDAYLSSITLSRALMSQALGQSRGCFAAPHDARRSACYIFIPERFDISDEVGSVGAIRCCSSASIAGRAGHAGRDWRCLAARASMMPMRAAPCPSQFPPARGTVRSGLRKICAKRCEAVVCYRVSPTPF